MNASTRKMLQKRKQMMLDSRKIPSNIDELEIREATKERFRELLSNDASKDQIKKPSNNQPLQLAKSIEETLHNTYKAHTSEYKASFRRLYVSLKSTSLPFKTQLLSGDLDPVSFALKSADELKGKDRLSKDETMKKEEMRMSVGVQLLPETVNQVKDGRDREKWGVSRSAAAIDD